MHKKAIDQLQKALPDPLLKFSFTQLQYQIILFYLPKPKKLKEANDSKTFNLGYSNLITTNDRLWEIFKLKNRRKLTMLLL